MEHRGKHLYVSFGRTMMQALELLWLAKRDEATLNNEELNQARVAIASHCMIELHAL